MPDMSLYRSCMAFFSDLSTIEDASSFSYETSEIYDPVPEERKPHKQLRLTAWFDKALTLNWIELNGTWVRDLPGPMHLGLRTGPLCPMFCTKLEEPVPLPKFQMASLLSFLIYSGPKKKEPRCACLSEAKASHSHKMWTDVFFLRTTFPTRGVVTQPHYI